MIKNFTSFINEMAKLDKINNKLSIDGVPLKKIPLELVKPNIVIWRNEEDDYPLIEGYTMVWYINDDKNAYLLNDKKNQLLFIDKIDLNNESVLKNIWFNNTKEQKNILGCIQAYTNEDEIIIYLMSVRPSYERNGINRLMVQALINKYPNAKLTFDGVSPQGELFIQRHFPDSERI